MDPNIGKNLEEVLIELTDSLKNDLIDQKTDYLKKEFNWKEEITKPKFIFILFIGITRFASVDYFGCNYYYIGNSILKNDSMTFNFLLISSITNIAGRLTSGYFWDKFGVIKSCLFCYLMTILLDIIFVFWAEHSAFGMFVMIFITRFSLIYNVLFNSMTLFAIYDLKTAINLSPFYEIMHAVRSLIENAFQWTLLIKSDFRRVFIGFLVFDIICFGIFLMKKDTISLSK